MASLVSLLDGQPPFATLQAFYWTLLSGLCEGGYFVFLALSLERLPLGVAYPVSRGGAMGLVWIVSLLTAADVLSSPGVSGAALIFIGMILLREPAKQGARARDLRPPLFTAVFIAGYHFFYGFAIHARGTPSAIFAVSVWVGLPIFMIFSGKAFIRKTFEQFRAEKVTTILGGTLCFLSFFLFLRSLGSVGPGKAIALRNTSILFAQIFSLYLGERLSRTQWLGTIVLALGATLVAI